MLINTCTRVVCVWKSWGKQLHGQYICTFLHTFPLHMHLCTHTHTNTVIMYRTVPYRWELWSDIRGGSVSYHTPLLHLHMTWGCHYCWDGCIVLCSQLHALVCVCVCFQIMCVSNACCVWGIWSDSWCVGDLIHGATRWPLKARNFFLSITIATCSMPCR